MQAGAIVAFIGMGFCLVGLATLTFFIHRLRKARRSRHWPVVRGRLEQAGLRQVFYNGREADGSADMASALVVDFRYRYEVDGTVYQGSRVTFSDHVSKPAGSLRKLQAKFQVGQTVSVYYNPDDPSDSVLLPGPRITHFTPMITSLAFLAVGAYLVFM